MFTKRRFDSICSTDTGSERDVLVKRHRESGVSRNGGDRDIVPLALQRGGRPAIFDTRVYAVGIDTILAEESSDEENTEEIYEENSLRRPPVDDGFPFTGRPYADSQKDVLRRWKQGGEQTTAKRRNLDGVIIRKPKLARYASVFSKFTQAKRKEYKTRKAKWRVPQKHEYYRKNFSRGIESSGDKRIRELRDALSQLDHLGFMRSSHQREFHEAFIGACLPQIYGEDFDRNLVKILRENSLDEIRCEIMVCCPRRWGKTMAVALYAAAYLWTQPEAEIIIYSIAKRTSSMMSSKIYNMIVKLCGGEHCVVTHNQEDLVITNMHGGESVLHSYPAASRISIFFYCVFVRL